MSRGIRSTEFSEVSVLLKIEVLGGGAEWAQIKMTSAYHRPFSAVSLDQGFPGEVPGTAASVSSGSLIRMVRNASSWVPPQTY